MQPKVTLPTQSNLCIPITPSYQCIPVHTHVQTPVDHLPPYCLPGTRITNGHAGMAASLAHFLPTHAYCQRPLIAGPAIGARIDGAQPQLKFPPDLGSAHTCITCDGAVAPASAAPTIAQLPLPRLPLRCRS